MPPTLHQTIVWVKRWHDAAVDDDTYEGSARQQRRMRRARVVAVIVALAMLAPIVVATASAISR